MITEKTTKKLIKVLAGLCIDKDLEYQYDPHRGMLFIDLNENECYHHEIELDEPCTKEQLQDAIEKVNQL